jgi:hypothetical protein
VVSVLFGAFGSGLIGDPNAYWGFVIGETWVLSAVLYVACVFISLRLSPNAKSLLGFSKEAAEADVAPGAIVDMATDAGL